MVRNDNHTLALAGNSHRPVIHASRPALLRGLAGAPAGMRHARRGSFLVMVVGTLALLAVVAIIYVTLGNQDVRTKAAAERHENLEEVPAQIRDYIASIIADDRLDTYYP